MINVDIKSNLVGYEKNKWDSVVYVWNEAATSAAYDGRVYVIAWACRFNSMIAGLSAAQSAHI